MRGQGSAWHGQRTVRGRRTPSFSLIAPLKKVNKGRLTLVLLVDLEFAEVLSLPFGGREEPFSGLAIIDALGLVVRGINGSWVALGISLQLLFIEFLEVLNTIHQLIVLAGLVQVLSALLLQDTRVGEEFVQRVLVLNVGIELRLLVELLHYLQLGILLALLKHVRTLLNLKEHVGIIVASLAESW